MFSRRPCPECMGVLLTNGHRIATNLLPLCRPKSTLSVSPGGVAGVLRTIASEEGFSALWAGTTPRVARSVLSGAIQFGSYEFVKGLFGVEPRKL